MDYARPTAPFYMLLVVAGLVKVSLFLGAGASAMFGKPDAREFLQLLPQHLDGKANEIYAHLLSKQRFREIEDILQWLDHMQYKGAEAAKLERQVESAIKSCYGWDCDHDAQLQKTYGPVFSRMMLQSDSCTVFTTNYDTAIEKYCEIARCVCVDGFDKGSDHIWDGNFDVQDSYCSIRLYKLHGSLDWKLHGEHGVVRESGLADGSNVGKDTMITHGYAIRDEYKKAFYEEVLRLAKKEFMKQDACVAIGCSFRQTAGEFFREFIRGDKTVVVISPTVVEDMNRLFNLECESTREDLGQLRISPKDGQWSVSGFDAKLKDGNAVELILKSFDIIRNCGGRHG